MTHHIIVLKSATCFKKPRNRKSKVLNRAVRNCIAKCKEPVTSNEMLHFIFLWRSENSTPNYFCRITQLGQSKDILTIHCSSLSTSSVWKENLGWTDHSKTHCMCLSALPTFNSWLEKKNRTSQIKTQKPKCKRWHILMLYDLR